MKVLVTGLNELKEQLQALERKQIKKATLAYQEVVRETLDYALTYSARMTGLATQGWIVNVNTPNVTLDELRGKGRTKVREEHKGLAKKHGIFAENLGKGRWSLDSKGTREKPLDLENDMGLISEVMALNESKISKLRLKDKVSIFNAAPEGNIIWLKGKKNHLRSVNQQAKSYMQIRNHMTKVIIPTAKARQGIK